MSLEAEYPCILIKKKNHTIRYYYLYIFSTLLAVFPFSAQVEIKKFVVKNP